jgi:hypothetical protein
MKSWAACFNGFVKAVNSSSPGFSKKPRALNAKAAEHAQRAAKICLRFLVIGLQLCEARLH